MKIRVFTCLLVAAALILACQAASPVEPAGSGIEGQVSIGPSSAIVGVGTPSANEPYEAIIVIKDGATGEEIAQVQSGPDGSFRIGMEPGEYLLEPQSPNPGAPPFAEPLTVVVQADQFTYVEIVYESGIR